METAIDYLNEVHGDLLDAAKRERAGLPHVQGRRLRRWASSRLVGAAGGRDCGSGSRRTCRSVRRVGAGDGADAPVRRDAATGATGRRVVWGAACSRAGSPAPAWGRAGARIAPSLSRIIRTGEISLVIPRGSFDDGSAKPSTSPRSMAASWRTHGAGTAPGASRFGFRPRTSTRRCGRSANSGPSRWSPFAART